MALNGQKLTDLLVGLLNSTEAAEKTRTEQFACKRSKEIHIPLAATCDLGVFTTDKAIVVESVEIESAATVASSATDYWQFQVVYDDNAAGSDTAITGTFTGTTTALAANVGTALTMSTTGGVAVASAKRVALKATKTASAADIRIRVQVNYKEN